MRIQITLIVFCMSLSACGTIFGTHDRISFTSEPPEAKIYINGRYLGKTPTSVQVTRSFMSGGPPQITVEKEGYKRQEFELSKEFNVVSLGNLSSIFSWATDFVSGAVMRFSPTDYRIVLESEHAAYRPQELEMLRFVLFNFENIQEDIAKRGGEYLETMILLDTPVEKKDAYLKKILNDSDYLKVASPTEMIR